MAYDPATGMWKPEDDSVSTRVTGLLKADSPYLKQARTDAAKTANRRGLLNSSIAAGAGTDAAIRSSLPIASQEAQQIADKNLSAQGFNQNTALQAQDIASREKIATQNIASSEREKSISAIAALENSYTEAFRTIAQNPDLNSEARNQYLDHLGAQRDANFNLVEQVYGIDLEWPSTAAVWPPGGARTALEASQGGGGSATAASPVDTLNNALASELGIPVSEVKAMNSWDRDRIALQYGIPIAGISTPLPPWVSNFGGVSGVDSAGIGSTGAGSTGNVGGIGAEADASADGFSGGPGVGGPDGMSGDGQAF